MLKFSKRTQGIKETVLKTCVYILMFYLIEKWCHKYDEK